jgi:uncharacterized membrane protein YoaK (UPF0700 family)
LLLVLVFLGAAEFYSDKVPFDTDENYTFVEFFVIGTLCFVCGLKNSLVTWASWGKIKVTHLTGLSTDIGLNLIRTFYRKQSAPRFKEQRLVNILRLSTFFCFSSGAAVSALLFPSLGFQVLFLPALISLLMTIISIWDVQKHSIKENSKVEFSQI